MSTTAPRARFCCPPDAVWPPSAPAGAARLRLCRCIGFGLNTVRIGLSGRGILERYRLTRTRGERGSLRGEGARRQLVVPRKVLQIGAVLLLLLLLLLLLDLALHGHLLLERRNVLQLLHHSSANHRCESAAQREKDRSQAAVLSPAAGSPAPPPAQPHRKPSQAQQQHEVACQGGFETSHNQGQERDTASARTCRCWSWTMFCICARYSCVCCGIGCPAPCAAAAGAAGAGFGAGFGRGCCCAGRGCGCGCGCGFGSSSLGGAG